MFQIFDTLKFYICFICYDVFHIHLSWDSLWIHGMYVCMYVMIQQLFKQNSNTTDLCCLGGNQLRSRLWHQLLWPRLFMIFCSPSSSCWESVSDSASTTS
jgi:hypothetical protein